MEGNIPSCVIASAKVGQIIRLCKKSHIFLLTFVGFSSKEYICHRDVSH